MPVPKKKAKTGKKKIADRNRSNIPRVLPPPPPDLIDVVSGSGSGPLEIKPAPADQKSLLDKIDLTPPGAPDAEAADRADRKPKKLTGSEKPRLAVDQFEFKNEDLFGIFQVWNLIIAGRSQKWILTDNEIQALVRSLPPVLKKYLPEVAEYLPEVALLQTVAGIVLTRLSFSAPEIELPPVSIPDPNKPPGPAVLDLNNLADQAKKNEDKKE